MFILRMNAPITMPFASFLLPLTTSLPTSSSPISQAGGVQLRGALAPKGGPGAPRHPVMSECGATLRCHRAQWHHPSPPAPHQVLHHCLQVRASCCVQYTVCIIVMAVNMLHSGTVVPMKVLGKSVTDVIMMTSSLQSLGH